MHRHLHSAGRYFLVLCLLAALPRELVSLAIARAAPLNNALESQLGQPQSPTIGVDCLPSLGTSDMVSPDADTPAMEGPSGRKVATFAGALGGTFAMLSLASFVVSALVYMRKRRDRRKAEGTGRNGHPRPEDAEDDDIDGMSTRPVPTAEVTLRTFHPFDTRLPSLEPVPARPPPYTPAVTIGHTNGIAQESPPTFAEAISSPIPPLLANLRRSAARI
ncbi:hypothetical protein OE88DRAFT_822692 [Heliocybe sulcata]|uniref:Mid2 domain-containing protein n=1 Tax=Heliocybe sulcata TaxID=5364 RepID=A0A5C3MP67_9AGAM|nr:hypothetical protein OE88DRAFT_822692 [Heliocybe sulcata]